MKIPTDETHPPLSDRCQSTLQSGARLGPGESIKPDLLTGVACGKLAALGFFERVSDKPRRFVITPAGRAWLAEHERRRNLAPPQDPQLSLLTDPL